MRSATIESSRVESELVAALFTASVPLLIMAATYLFVGSYIFILTKAPLVATALVVGMAAVLGKAFLHLWFRRSRGPISLGPTLTRAWDRRFAIGNLSFAAAVGSLVATTFLTSSMAAQLLGTGLLFGFCSGQVARVAVRARMCAISIFVAAVPCVFAAAASGETSHLLLAGMFLLFAVGSTESVRFTYQQARDRIGLNHELEGAASRDPLTGLPNRLGLRRAVADLWSTSAPGSQVAVHCLDLDGFKLLNDRHGHAAGDAVLTELARRLQPCLRDTDTAARMGGDEFVILQGGLHHADEAEMFARRVCRLATAGYLHGSSALSAGVSIGTCTGHLSKDSFDDLLAVADGRMYAAKQAGGGVHTASGAPLQRS